MPPQILDTVWTFLRAGKVMSADGNLSDQDKAVLESLDDVWVTYAEVAGTVARHQRVSQRSDKSLVAVLKRLRRLGLAAYRVSDAHRAGEWAVTEEGDKRLGRDLRVSERWATPYDR